MSSVKSRKQIAAEETQRVIVETASRLFIERGYHATSISLIATEAGVAIQAIYNSVGSKRDLLSRVLDFAAAGARAPTPVAQFMREQAELETDPHRLIAQITELWSTALPRTAPIFRIIREVAATDPEIAELERTRASQRLSNYGHAATLLAKQGVLRNGLTVEAAAAAIFAIGHPETYRTLVTDGHWSSARWTSWAQTALENTLLEPDTI